MSILEEQEDGSVCGEGGQRATTWLDRWTPSRTSLDHGCSINRDRRASTDQRDPIKTLEMDTTRLSTCANPTTNYQKLHQLHTHPHHLPYHTASSTLHEYPSSYHNNYPATPCPVKTRPLQVRSAGPRCGREEKTSFCAHTPRPSSFYHHPGACLTALRHHHTASAAAVPNYMTATASAKARLRSQSTPRQRHGGSPPEREPPVGSAKKRLSFPVPDPSGADGYQRSPSFKSANGRLGMDHMSAISSCAESLPGDVSPSSATDLCRWLRSGK